MNLRPAYHPRGSAIIWVLLLCGFLTVICLTFLGTATASKKEAHAGNDETTADDLLASAQGEVLAKLAPPGIGNDMWRPRQDCWRSGATMWS